MLFFEDLNLIDENFAEDDEEDTRSDDIVYLTLAKKNNGKFFKNRLSNMIEKSYEYQKLKPTLTLKKNLKRGFEALGR